jgi:hypothetical protein
MASDEVRSGASPCPTTFEEELQKMEREGREAADVEAKEREFESLKRRAQELEGELSVARVAQRRRSAEAALPVFQPHEPCSAPWVEMKGDARVRACSRCKQRVYDLSGLAADDARKLLAGREGRLPTHLMARADGTVTASACEARRTKMSPMTIALAAASAAGLFGGGLATGLLWNGDAPAPQVIQLTIPEAPKAIVPAAVAETPPPPVKPPEATPPPKQPDPPAARGEESDRPRRDRHHRHHHGGCGRGGELPSLFWLFISDEEQQQQPACDGESAAFDGYYGDEDPEDDES